MVSEFSLIHQFFNRPTQHTDLAGGDDAALMTLRPGYQLAVSSDMLVAGRHFYLDANPYYLGRKAAAVNLSDMAAMGAEPRWATLAISMPEQDESWIRPFAEGFYEALSNHGADWVGGDTTRGPLNLAVTIMGEVPIGKALKRSGARADDDIWVSGTLGDAAWALRYQKCEVELNESEILYCTSRLDNPTPRVGLGQALLYHAHSAIDISDGLLADLNHILEASDVGAVVDVRLIPLSPALTAYYSHNLLWQSVLSGGDDYELCFTAPESEAQAILQLGKEHQVPLARIGKITNQPQERRLLNLQGEAASYWKGYDHFRD